jgi:copper(I)-binding protein
MRRHPILPFALVALAALLATCSSPAASGLSVADAWARPGVSGAETAAYFTITNPSTAEDALLSVSSPAASMVQLHQTSTDASGMTGMAPVTEIAVPAGGSVALAPGGYHVMVMGLGQDLTVGGTLELQLRFRNAGTLTVQATIRQD